MLSPVMSQALCLPAEALLNRVLRQDTAALARLARHEGRMIGIDVQGRMRLNLRLLRDGIALSMTAETPADVILTGSLQDFLKLARASDKASELINSQIDMDGDTELALTLTRTVQNLDIDWEALIQPVTGSLLAHQLGKGVRSLLQWSRDTSSTYRRAAKEYLEDEAGIVTPAPLLNEFSAATDALRLAADRIEARIARLENKNSEE